MSKSVIISLLGRANNGNEILQILDTLAESSDDNAEGADMIEF